MSEQRKLWTAIIISTLVLLASYSNGQFSQKNIEQYQERNENEFKQLKKREFKDQPEHDLVSLVQLGQIWVTLGQESRSDQACALLSKGIKQFNQESQKTLYFLAEANRIFKCKQLDKIKDQIETSLKDTKNLEQISSIYYLYLLNKEAKSYSVKTSPEFNTFIASKMKEDWLVNFNAEDWSYNSETKGKGLTLDSLYIAQIISSQLKDQDLKEKIETKLKSAFGKVISQAFEDESTWFIITKNANEGHNTEMNLQILSLMTSMQKVNIDMKTENLIKFRNYFFYKVLGAQSINDFYYALLGLNQLNDFPFIMADSNGIINLGDTKSQIKFELVDMLGNPFSGLKSSKLVLKPLDSSLPQIDASSSTKVSSKFNSLTLSPQSGDLKSIQGFYNVIFEIEGSGKPYSLKYSKFLKIVDKLKAESFSYSVISTQNFPNNIEKQVQYPGTINKATDIDIQEGFYLHIAVKAKFQKLKDQISQVYLSLRKVGTSSDKNLYSNVYGKFNEEKQQYEITLDVQNDLEHLNGEYEVQIHIADFKSSGKIVWEIGKVNIWFKQGQDSGNNQGIKEQYQPKKLITHIFPPENLDQPFVMPMIGVGLIVFSFLYFMKQICSYGSNVSKLSFMGVLLLLNILLILGIFTMFWIKVKLIPTLWILLAIAPISFFIVNKALIMVDCNIPEFRSIGSKKKDQ